MFIFQKFLIQKKKKEKKIKADYAGGQPPTSKYIQTISLFLIVFTGRLIAGPRQSQLNYRINSNNDALFALVFNLVI